MIISMKKAVLLCLEQDKTQTLEKLRSLGVMQLEYAKKPSSESVDVHTKNIVDSERAAALISGAPGRAAKNASSLSGREVVARVNELIEEQSKLRKELDTLIRTEEKLRPWGDFKTGSLDSLRSKGMYARLSICQNKVFGAWIESLGGDVTVREINRDAEFVYALVLSLTPIDEKLIDDPRLPSDTTLGEVRSAIGRAQTALADINSEFAFFKKSLNAVSEYRAKEIDSLEFVSARDGMAESGKIAYIYGYVPVTGVESLRKTAFENGWAISLEDPAPDDDHVPTLIKKPAFLDVMDPLFDFIGVAPGYRENDVNVFFLLFFPIFFGMIIGDAGYAMLFIVASIVCKSLFRKVEAARLPLNLMILLSIVTLVWGWLNGAWCGIPRDMLPSFMRGCNFIADPDASPLAHEYAKYVGLVNDKMTDAQITGVMGDFKNKFIQFICFALACLHLTSARIFRFFDDIRRSWRAFGHLGWGMLIIANSFMAVNLIVYPGTFPGWGMYLYIVGAVLVTVTVSGAGALNLPFSLIGSFVDVLSYIRLFAVGLAGAYISEKFNEMGGMIATSFSGWAMVVGYACLILVAVFGNLLNIALGFLGVLVHAVRLNTLEFSNHIEMQWTGYKFRPFSKKNNEVQIQK